MKNLILILLASTSCFACKQPAANTDTLIIENQSEITNENQLNLNSDTITKASITIIEKARNNRKIQ